jgi:hypothetical protein
MNVDKRELRLQPREGMTVADDMDVGLQWVALNVQSVKDGGSEYVAQGGRWKGEICG